MAIAGDFEKVYTIGAGTNYYFVLSGIIWFF
jgi:hypothetical protein